MRRKYLSLPLAISAIILCSSLALNPAGRMAFAHTFKGDENVAFLSMVQQIKIETSLAANNTSNKDISNQHLAFARLALSNSTLKEIAEKNQRIAADLPTSIEKLRTSINSNNATESDISQQTQAISDLLDEAVQVRIDKAQASNSTVQALVVANLVNQALTHYGKAVGFEGNMTDMSTMAMSPSDGQSMSSMQHGSNMQGGMSMNSSGNQTSKIVSEAHFQSAQASAEKAQTLYLTIKTQAVTGKEAAVKALDGSFPAFVKAISMKASPMEIMNLAHTKIHPNLMEAYNLTVIG